MKDFLTPYLKCSPTNIILHVGTNNSINDLSSVILNKILLLKTFVDTELPESNVMLSIIIDRSNNGIARSKISNLNKHLNSLKIDTIDDGNISLEHWNGSGLHLNRHGDGKLAINLIKKLHELRCRNFDKNWQLSGQSLARPQYYVLDFVCNNVCKRKSDTAGPKHLLEIKLTSTSTNFQDKGNQTSTLNERRIKNVNRLVIGHLNVKSPRNKFEMLEELIKDKIDIFLISDIKVDSSFPSGQFVIKGYSTSFRLDRNQNGGGLLLHVRENILCKIQRE